MWRYGHAWDVEIADYHREHNDMSIRIEDLGRTDVADVADLAAGRLAPVSPGEMLAEEFLAPAGLSQYALAKALGVSPRRINEIVHGKRAITADTDLRLCRFFGLSDGWWLRLQGDYDIALAKAGMGAVLAGIAPLRAA